MTQSKRLEMPNSDGFAARLKEAIGNESILSFSKRCGISEGTTRKYLTGSQPGIDKLLTLAAVAGVTIEWLATGRASELCGDRSFSLKTISHDQAAMASHAMCQLAAMGADEVRIQKSCNALLDALSSIRQRFNSRSGSSEPEQPVGRTAS